MGEFFYEGVDAEKQLVPKPLNDEESLQDLLEGKKQIYIDPKYIPPDPYDEQPEYDEDEIPDYALDEEDSVTEILNDIKIKNYDVEKQ